ncbi:MAG: hypothetical protein E7159_04825 [Firmicutes bacterium]|nr:hypothetical protein [Bacillota bacterium]
MEETKLKIGKMYVAVLKDVIWEYDHIRNIYVVKFKYIVYLSPTETREVEDVFYWWDSPRYRANTINKMIKISQMYDIRLNDKDYKSEFAFAGAFKWLIDTRVVISPYRYRGIKYKVVCTERNNWEDTISLWNYMKKNN